MKIAIEITGVSPLLMNRFIDESGIKRDKSLTAREEAEKTAYLTEEGKLYYPPENILSCIMSGGRFHKDGKTKITTARSSLVPAGVSVVDKILYFSQPSSFEVDSRAVVIPSTGGRIMKHRARLDDWVLEFNLTLDTAIFHEKTLRAIIDDAGSKCGLGDFRPERKGYFGRFVVTKWVKD